MVSPPVVRTPMNQIRAQRYDAAELTRRALEVLDLLARRWDNRRIATGAQMSRATVNGDISGILPKLNVENRVRVAVRARKESLLDQQESP